MVQIYKTNNVWLSLFTSRYGYDEQAAYHEA